MMQEHDKGKKHSHPHAGGDLSHLNVGGLRKRTAAAAQAALEELKRAEAAIESGSLSEEAKAEALHALEHAKEALSKKAPVRKCLRRKTVTLKDQGRMHGGCGGI